MKKFVVALVLVIGFGAYMFWSSRGGSPLTAADAASSEPETEPGTPSSEVTQIQAAKKSSPTPSPVPEPLPAPTPTPMPMMGGTPPPAMHMGLYVDGTYTGEAVGTIFGIVQVAAVVSGGRLSDVQFLQFPNDQPNSIAISDRSLPILRSEAIAAQRANVDNVSGATQTWEGFVQSLGVALTKAKS